MAEEQNVPLSEVIQLQSSEGEIFEVSLKVARVSRTLSTMLADLGHEQNDVIPLPNVNSSILKRVLAWSEHSVSEGLDLQSNLVPSLHQSPSPTPPVSSPSSGQMPFQPRPQPHVPHRSSRRVLPPPGHTLSSWEKEFLSHNKDKVYELLLAANYLDIKSLLDVLCRVVADMIKGRDPQDIRRAFHASDPSGDWLARTDTPSSSSEQQESDSRQDNSSRSKEKT